MNGVASAIPGCVWRGFGVLIRVSAVAAAVAALAAAPARGQYNYVPKEREGLELSPRVGERVPRDLEFVDSGGKSVRLGSVFRGRPVLLMMVYHRCPLLCPKLQRELVKSLSGLDFTVGTEFDVVLVSFDPRDGSAEGERAKTDALMAYEKQITESVRTNWHFLTGSAEGSRRLADALGFGYRYLPASGEYVHATAVYVLTPDGVISNCFPKPLLPERDMRFALMEASGGRLGTIMDRITLWCFHPEGTGKYTVYAMRLMQVCAGLVAAAVVGLLGVLWVREVRNKARARGGRGAGAAGLSASITGHSP